LIELVRDILREQAVFKNDDPELIKKAKWVQATISILADMFDVPELTLDQLLQKSTVTEALEDVDVALGNLIRQLKPASVRSAGFDNCYSRAMKLADLFTLLTEVIHRDDDYAHWLDLQNFESGRKGFTIYLSPVDITRHLGPLIKGSNAKWFFVSATLAVAESFDHFRASLGIDDVIEKKFDSPFNFAEQVQAYVPENLPDPGSDKHTKELLSATLPLIRASSGRTFFLFTSHRALRLTARLLEEEYDIVFLQQGVMPKKLLLQKFREVPRCVLLATRSFWEGVDVKGADLRCLVIDKLPFSSPDDHMVRAQIRAIESAGGNGFRQFTLPEAAISLKQGFGRLIRQESDRGIFVLGDARINTRSYGKLLKLSLPPMTWIGSQQQALEYVESIEKAR
jgi:ATP-dependent DNA helicase DinG